MPTPTGKARPGDVYAIPLEESRHALVKVVYVSRYFRNVIGIAIASDLRADTSDTAEFPPNLPLAYTAQVCAKVDWYFLRTEPVCEAEIARTLRVVGGEVWLGDDCIRPASREELRVLPKMGVLGCVGVIDLLRRHFALPPIPRP